MAAAGVTRVLTGAAVAFLAFDGVALLVAAAWLRELGLACIGLVLIASTLLVIRYGRRHAAALEAIAEERRQLREQVRAMQDLVRRMP